MDDEERKRCVMLSRDQNAPKMPEDQLLLSEVAVYSGGKDREGRPIITFPSRHHALLGLEVKPTGLDHILRYYADLTSSRDKTRGLAFVTDLRFASLELISLLKSSLNSLQAEMQGFGSKCILYAIQPLDKKIFKDAMTILALRVSKKKKNKSLASPIFQTVLVAEEADLHNYVDRSQLLADVGGYLQYSHPAWVRFMKAVEPFFATFHECSFKYPAALDSISRLGELKLGQAQEELEQQLAEIKQSHDQTLGESTLPSTLAAGSELLHKLRHSEEDTTFGDVAQRPVFKDTHAHVRDCVANLKDMRSHFEVLWKNAEARIHQALSALEYSAQLKQLIKWFTKDSKRLLKKGEVGETAGRAEALKNHFETAELPLAEEKIANAEQLVERIQATVVAEVPQEGAVDVRTQARRLTKILREFRKRLDQTEDFYLAVCDYYTIYDEIDRWCDKVLRFLPPNIDKIHEFLASNHLSRRAAILVEWRESLRRFQRRRPPPDDEDIVNLEQTVKVIGDPAMERRALELIDRFDTLMSVLSAKRPAVHRDVQQAMRWRHHLLETGNGADSDRLSHSSYLTENRSVSGHEDQLADASDPLPPGRHDISGMTFGNPGHQGGGDTLVNSFGVGVRGGDEMDGGRYSGGSSLHSVHEDPGSVSAHSQTQSVHSQSHSVHSQTHSVHSQASSVGRISSKDYYSGNLPPVDHQGRFLPGSGGQGLSTLPHKQYSQQQQSSLSGRHPQQSALLRQHFMLSASQPHLPGNAVQAYGYSGYVDRQYHSPYIIRNEYLHSDGAPELHYPSSVVGGRSDPVSYIPMLSDIEGSNSIPHHPQTVIRRGQEGAMNGHDTLTNGHHHHHDGSYLTTQNGQPDLSPGQIPDPMRTLSGENFHTSTPVRNGGAPFAPRQYDTARLPFDQSAIYQHPVSHQTGGDIRPHGGERPSYDDIVNGIRRLQAQSPPDYGHPHHRSAGIAAKSAPDLSRLSELDVNFDLDPEVVASELDSDEQVEYYRRVAGFLKGLPTKKRKPRRLRTRQAKAKEDAAVVASGVVRNDADRRNGDVSLHPNLDRASEHSRSTGSLFDTSLNEDMSMNSSSGYNHGSSARERAPGPVGTDSHGLRQSGGQEGTMTMGKEGHGGVCDRVVERPSTGLGRNQSPTRRRNLIPEGTPPIAPLTDSLRRFLEDTERDRGTPQREGTLWEGDVQDGDDDGDGIDEDLRRYEELLSQREEDLEKLALPGEDDTDVEDLDLLEPEEFLTEVTAIEATQERSHRETERVVAGGDIQIGLADRLLQKLEREEGEGGRRIHGEGGHRIHGGGSPHLSDEGAVLDGLSIDDAGEHGSSITTERGSVESGVGGMQYRRGEVSGGRYPSHV